MTAAPVWRKLGRVFRADGQRSWMRSHTACPVGLPLGDGTVRIFFGTRDADNRPHMGFVTIGLDAPAEVLEISQTPCLGPGAWGMFDDNGVYPGTLLADGETLRLYYMGRSNGVPPLYTMAIGLAVSTDGGRTFERLHQAPILQRGRHDPWMVSTPCVYPAPSGGWLMLYLSGLCWRSLEPPHSLYHLKIALSDDGVEWVRHGDVAFDFLDDETNLASPTIYPSAAGLEAVFCAARETGSYVLQGGWSVDGVTWRRTGTPPGLGLGPEDWDSAGMAYPSTFVSGGRLYLLYSGNSNGRDGFGLAVLEGAAP